MVAEHMFIVGAGFSFHAGLPLTSEFTRELLDVSNYKDVAPSKRQVDFLRTFVGDVFDHRMSAKARFWPYLEDIFTSVDLAANTGHHLGPNYSPSDLRTVRRAMIVRIIRMLRQSYMRKKGHKDTAWNRLEHFFRRVDLNKSAFLSMNWDTVIEEGLERTQKVGRFDYACGAHKVEFDEDNKLVLSKTKKPIASVIKMHGSSNWLYCDSCRELLWVEPSMSVKVADLLFQKRDWNTVSQIMNSEMNDNDDVGPTSCPLCSAPSIGTRFATFSYRKALDFPMYEKSWLAAESLLRAAKTWTFIGYSLPAADYQFKHLLKHVELSRKRTPEMILISGGEGAQSTLRNYQKFFGPKVSHKRQTFFDEGLNKNALDRLKELGALSNSFFH